MKRLTIALAALLCCTATFAQGEGGISADMLSQIRKGYTASTIR